MNIVKKITDILLLYAGKAIAALLSIYFVIAAIIVFQADKYFKIWNTDDAYTLVYYFFTSYILSFIIIELIHLKHLLKKQN